MATNDITKLLAEDVVPKFLCTANHSGHPYHPYNEGAHLTLMILMILCMPFILISSSLLIATVVLHKELHNTHNYIILALAVTDMLVGLIVIPFTAVAEMPGTTLLIRCSKIACLLLGTTTVFVTDINMTCLSFLCVSRFFLVNWPLLYRRKLTVRNTISVLMTVLFIQFSIIATVVGFRAQDDFSCWGRGELPAWFIRFYFLPIWLLRLVICVTVCIQVSMIVWKNETHNDAEQLKWAKVTMILLMLFIVFYLPTAVVIVVLSTGVGNRNVATYELLIDLAQFLRLLVPMSNGFAIYFNRPIYRLSFKYFLTTNPLHWRGVVKKKQLIKMERLISKAETEHTLDDVQSNVQSSSLSYDNIESTDGKISGLPGTCSSGPPQTDHTTSSRRFSDVRQSSFAYKCAGYLIRFNYNSEDIGKMRGRSYVESLGTFSDHKDGKARTSKDRSAIMAKQVGTLSSETHSGKTGSWDKCSTLSKEESSKKESR